MTGYKRGDIILVNFVFSDETGIKRRPAVVLSSVEYHQGRQEVIIAAVTGNTERLLTGDLLIKDWEAAGLFFPSIVTGILRTIKHSMITRKLGVITTQDMLALDNNLRLILDL